MGGEGEGEGVWEGRGRVTPLYGVWLMSVYRRLVCVRCSSFDEYAAEVRSGRLEWSPVHRSDKFWVRGGEGRGGGLSSMLEPLKTIKMCELSSNLVGLHLPSLSLAAEGECHEAAREQERAPQVSGRGAVVRVLWAGCCRPGPFSAVHCECPCVQPLPPPLPSGCWCQ